MPRWREWWPAWVLAVLAVPALGGAALLHPTRLALGAPTSEAPAHLWATWGILSTFFESPFVLDVPAAFPEGVVQPVTNPANLLLTLPVYLLAGGGRAGVALAWNALAVAGPIAAGLGLAWLGGLLHEDASPRIRGALRALGVVCGTAAAHWVTFPWTGRAEFFAAALVPWLLGALWLSLRPGGRLEWAGLAGLLLGLTALGGPYLGPFMALSLPAFAVVLGTRAHREGSPWKGIGTALALCGGLGLAVSLPLAWQLLTSEWPGLSGGGGPGAVARIHELWVALRLAAPEDTVRFGGDLLVHAHGRTQSVVLPGVAAVGLGLVGLARRRWAWLLAALWTWSLGYGPNLEVGDSLLLPLAPRLAQALLEPLSFVHNWSRIGCLVGIPVGLAAMEGLRWVLGPEPSRARLAAAGAVVGLVLLDLALVPGVPLQPRPTFDLRPPPGLVEADAALPPGALVVLPVWGVPGPPPGGFVEAATEPTGMARQAHLWGLALDRPVSATVDARGDALLRDALVPRVDVLTRHPAAPPLPAAECGRADALHLGEVGVAGVVVAQSLGPSPTLLEWLRAAWGPPLAEDADVVVWDPSRARPGRPCPLAPLPRDVEALLEHGLDSAGDRRLRRPAPQR